MEARRYSRGGGGDKPGDRRLSILIDANNKVWSPERKISATGSKKFSISDAGGLINQAFIGDNAGHRESLRPSHIGHSTDIRRKSVAYLRKELEIEYHVQDVDDLCKRLCTDLHKGLTASQIDKNRAQYGRNALTPPIVTPLWLKFIKTLMGGFQLLLWAAAILSFIAFGVQIYQLGFSNTPPDNLYLAVVLTVIVILLGVFTFYQEYSSGKVMDSFAKLVPAMATVTRDGKMIQLHCDELVVGDMVDVKFGDAIPADIRILECRGFKVDNSSLTGESEPQSRSAICTDDNPMETKNLAFFSTNALEGTAKGVVVAVGDKTFIGRIADLASGMDEIDTPIAREVSHFIRIISIVAAFLGISFFIISLSMGYNILASGTFLVAIIVANVPEGLLVTFTVILALTAKKMAAKNCVVRQLHAVETLGSCSVICSDKTGTLTQNKMTVSHLWYSDKVVDASLNDDGSPPNLLSDPGFMPLARVAALCSRAKFLSGQENVPIRQRTVNGDASESAILRFMEAILKGVEVFQRDRKKVFEVPFNSTNKWQLSIHTIEGKNVVEMKGAPERIATYCTRIKVGDTVQDFDQNRRQRFNQAYEDLGGLGERVIGFCELVLSPEEYPIGYEFDADDVSFLDKGMEFQGLVSMIDPPRPGVPQSVNLCRQAGIKVVMVTGDHPITAKAIARKVNIISPGNFTREEKAKSLKLDVDSIDPATCKAAVIAGHELLEMSTGELDEVLSIHEEIVFARVSPQQKLVIVEGFQRLGKIVALTGDGVNDSPALKKANIGVAMGIAGSDVSKQAADMILLDDNFASIVTGVEEGRLIFENLKKCIGYLLCANISTLTPFLLYILIKIPLPLGTIQMLAIVLGTDVLPTISLSYESPEGDIMLRPPRNPEKTKLVTEQMILYTYFVLGVVESIAGIFVYIVVLAHNGFMPDMLLGLSTKWDDTNVNDLQDSFGQEWTYNDRKTLMRTGWTGYFVGLVVCQYGNVLVCKCRRAPLWERLFSNWYVPASIVGETVAACILIYTPYFNNCVTFEPLKLIWWFYGLPFAFLLMAFDEFRRYIIRTKPQFTWFTQEFLY